MDESKSKPINTINCLLCGGVQIYPGPRYQNHLINEHGAVFDVEFLIKVSLYKRDKGHLPEDFSSSTSNGDVVESKKSVTIEAEVQTEPSADNHDETVCAKCNNPVAAVAENGGDYEDDDEYDEMVMGRLVMDMEEEDEEIDFESNGEEKVWTCPLCPHVFKHQGHFKTHAVSAHDMNVAEIESIVPVSMTEEDFLKRKEAADNQDEESQMDENQSFVLDKAKRKPIGKDWGPNSFSSTFTCYFCNEQFRKDYRLKLHLMLNHKNESAEEMSKAKEVLTKAKLDGCVHRCALCGSKYNSVANFTRHIKDVHQITRAQYRAEYGSSEVVSRMFKCELCDKEVKHTRNIIGAHMKMVHLISWKEYQEILIKIRQGETVGDLPAPELFECIICGVSVKYKREHLNKKHQITEDVYDQLIAKKSRGEDISDVLPEREIYKCLICERECMDIKKHIERSHQITEEMYEEMVASKAGESKRSVKQIQEEPMTCSKKLKASALELAAVDSESSGTASPNMFSSSSSGNNHSSSSSGALSTDLQCYFGCDESFKKDYQLHLHLKLKHRNEDPQELAKAYEAAEEEIALTRRSASIFNCALCPKTFNDNGAFYGHIQTKHNMVWKDYKEQYGRCEVESAPFECKICGRVVKYDRNTVHTHLKNVHGINWAMYLDRIRRMRRGEVPEDLPAPETHECRVCNVSVKYLKEHLKNAHKITEQEYDSLFDEDNADALEMPTAQQRQIPKPPPLTPKPQLKIRQPTPEVMLPLVTPPAHDPTLPKPPKSDITDKTNKTCSSCTITFDSRRSFIEHCTTVHNMRFKTKSGVTISGNTVQKRLQEEALKRQQQQNHHQGFKRKAEDQENFRNVAKKMNHGVDNDSLLDDGTIIGNSGKRTLYTPSGVSKWNQCKYECCFCKRTTMSRSSMTSHIHNTHGIPIKEYKESNYPDIEVETNWFQCRLCPARTKFVKDCIAPHLKMSHNMDIEVYERDVMQPEDWPYEVIPEPSLKHEMRSNKQALKVPQSVLKPDLHSPASIAPASVSNSSQPSSERDKWNRCKFACGLCDLVTVDSRQMRLHIATHHGLSMDAYTKQYGTTEIVTRKFRCELCNSEMKFCRQNIYAHMKDVHKITLIEYEAQTGVQALDIVPVEEMSESASPAPVRIRNSPAMKKQAAAAAAAAAAQQAAMNNADEIIVEGIDPTLAVAVTHGGDDYVDSGVLDDGKKPSRWNKCRFRCAICGKLSSEKRHVREHIIKFHGLSLPDYEAQYGDCEIHTEYFFCGVCHAEVKHNLKNISLHLQNVHAMSPPQYEMTYGMIPEDDDENGAVGVEPLIANVSGNADADYGFGGGGHFLLDDNNVETYDNPLDNSTHAKMAKPVANPPRSDILNPKNKYCKPCSRDFNRRQAFVEHCRTVHGMKIRFAKAATGTTIINSKAFQNQNSPLSSANTSPVAKTSNGASAGNTPTSSGGAAVGSSAAGYPCQYCGKLFSNQSNRRRHAVLSCELARNAGVEPRKSREAAAADKKLTQQKYHENNGIANEDFYYEDGAPGSKQAAEPQKCPVPECNVSHMRSALLKRHLFEAHNIQNVDHSSDASPRKSPMKIKSEPLDMLEIEHGDAEESGEQRKVPPLRVKISQVVSQSPNAGGKNVKPFVTCTICNEFKSNNLYILGRHKKSCAKKMNVSLDEHDTSANVTGNDHEEDEDEADATIEVPVDFVDEENQDDSELVENNAEIHDFVEPETTLDEDVENNDEEEMELAQDDDETKQDDDELEIKPEDDLEETEEAQDTTEDSAEVNDSAEMAEDESAELEDEKDIE